MAVERMRTCVSVDELAKELGVTRRCLYKWRTKLEAVEPGENTVLLSAKAESDRITRRSSVQIWPPQPFRETESPEPRIPAFFVRPLAEFRCVVHSSKETVLYDLHAPFRSQKRPASKVR